MFFVSIGLNVSFDGIGNQIDFMVALSIIAVLTTLLGGALEAKLAGFGTHYSSFIIGAGMVSGEKWP